MTHKTTFPFFTVYETRNLVNDKIYVGVHGTEDPYDDYLGSGAHFKRAVKKYGLENFQKKLILVTDSREDAYWLEGQIVTPEFCKRKNTYNIKLGGSGGWEYVNEYFNKGKIVSEQTRQKMSISGKKKIGPKNPFYGKSHTIENKQRISLEKSRPLIDDTGTYHQSVSIAAKHFNCCRETIRRRIKQGLYSYSQPEESLHQYTHIY